MAKAEKIEVRLSKQDRAILKRLIDALDRLAPPEPGSDKKRLRTPQGYAAGGYTREHPAGRDYVPVETSPRLMEKLLTRDPQVDESLREQGDIE